MATTTVGAKLRWLCGIAEPYTTDIKASLVFELLQVALKLLYGLLF